MKFLHVTDPHLVARGEKLHGLETEARFARCIDSINAHHADAHCCVITGDLADSGNAAAYDLLREQLQRCVVPTHLVIGNHDARDTFAEYFPDASDDSGGFVQSVRKTPVGVFLLLDTVQPGTHAGSYCEARCAWLKSKLEQYSADPVYIFMHHPPFDIHIKALDQIGLQDSDAFASLIQTHSNIRHIFFGHAHRPLGGSWRGISFSSLRGTNHQIELDFNASKLTYIDEAPDYSIVFIDDEKIVVHTHTY